jgi:hypothetical protein
VANYALDSIDERMVGHISEMSAGTKKVYFHKKGMPKPAYRTLRERFEAAGISEISSTDLEPLE